MSSKPLNSHNWILCSERLPNLNYDVICSDETGMTYKAYCNCHNKWIDVKTDQKINEVIVKWRPLDG